MILFCDRELVIVTPPKTASDSLHRLLCSPPWDGLAVVGRSRTGQIDKHLAELPAECLGFRVLATVRNPYDRLVSLYHQFSRHETYWGRAGLAFWDFCNRVGRPDEPIPEHTHALANLYRLNQVQWLDGLQPELVRVERLAAGLKSHGLAVEDVPRWNDSWRRATLDYFDESTLAAIREWARPDCERFGYQML